MSTQPQPIPSELNLGAGFRAKLTKAIHDHWRLILAEGVILILLGIAAIAVPVVAGLATTIFLGFMFLMAGIVGLVSTFSGRGLPGFWWSLFSAIVALIAGSILLYKPVLGMVSLTYVLIAYFIVDGILTIILALRHRDELSGRWQWLLANGVIDLILAAIIIGGLPGTLAWVLGLLVGIDFVFGGSSLIAMALWARDQEAPAGTIAAKPA
jgi:uncharacterized membrane protein HdeD (DUF308 family)